MPGGDKVGFRLVMIQHGNRVSLRRSKNTRKISLLDLFLASIYILN